MRRALVLALLGIGLSIPLISVAKQATETPTASPEAAADALTSLAPLPIQPHRATYDMKLASARNGSPVSSVSGRMVFEWADACDGWAVQQNLVLHFSYNGEEDADIASTSASWEAKDGKKMTFSVRRTTDGKETEKFKGKAELAAGGGTASFTVPKKKNMKIPAEAVFPSAHTNLVIAKALAGEKFFSRVVFDGSDADGMAETSAFIGTRQASLLPENAKPELKKIPALNVAGWPVRMAFFKMKSETGEPDYEMDLSLLANGVATSMKLDYGDFSVLGTLVEFEPLPASGC